MHGPATAEVEPVSAPADEVAATITVIADRFSPSLRLLAERA